MFHKFLYTLLTILSLILLYHEKGYSSYYFNSETLGQLRITQQNNYEFPLFQNLFLDVEKQDSQLSLKADLDIYGEPYFEEGNINLHAASLNLHSRFGLWDIELGRIRGNAFDYTILDGINLNLRPANHLLINAYSGAKRFLEKDGFLDANFIAGSKMSLLFTNNFTSSVNYEYEQDADGNYKSRVGGSAFLDINGPLSPRIYSLVGYDAASSTLENINAGFDLYPSTLTKITLDGGRFERANEGLDLNSIISTFAIGPISEIGELIEITPSSFFSIYERLSYSLYEYSEGVNSNGINLTTGINIFNFINHSTLGLNYFYLSSYGGIAYGADFGLKIIPTKILSINGKLGILSFDKTTGESGEAMSSRIAAEYFATKNVSIEVNGEYNSNSELINDLRAGFRLNILYF